jgi:hypothetical protein
MRKLTLYLLIVFAASACQQSNKQPVPSVSQIGGDITCTAGDHAFEDPEAGWGFCYPGTWKYNERSQFSTTPTRLDLTFDITDVPCVSPSPVSGETPHPVCSPGAGLFAFMIISTYERGSATDLASWMQANLNPVPVSQPILWGNATDAARFAAPDGRRIALTPHHVVIMDLRSGLAQLDLEGAMSARLDTWKFLY